MPDVKSPQLLALGLVDDGYSPLKVMKSAAGYYVGSTYLNRDDNGKALFEEPGTRDSGYFATPDEAQEWLEDLANHIEDPNTTEEPDGWRIEP